jgi:hypothetical protein
VSLPSSGQGTEDWTGGVVSWEVRDVVLLDLPSDPFIPSSLSSFFLLPLFLSVFVWLWRNYKSGKIFLRCLFFQDFHVVIAYNIYYVSGIMYFIAYYILYMRNYALCIR